MRASAYLSLRLLPLSVVLALIAGCAPETGVLVAVSGSDVDQLEFQVGVLQGEDFVLDGQVSGQLEDVRGRDLRANPFELMLRQDEAAATPPTLRALAIGWQITPEGRERYSFAVTEPPQTFVKDEVVRRNLVLQRINDNTRLWPLEGGCYRARSGEESWRWIHRADQDCDGYSPDGQPADCDDADASLYPGASELCDGKDNNCDGQPAPASLPCYGQGGEPYRCRIGTRLCDEANGGGLAPGCEVVKEDPAAPEAYCAAYAACDGVDPLSCVESTVQEYTVSCVIEAKDRSVCPGGSLELKPLFETDQCRWVIVSSEGLTFGLSTGGGSAVPEADRCEPLLVVSANPGAASGTAVLEFFDLAAGNSGVVVVTVTGQEMTSCAANPLQCELENP